MTGHPNHVADDDMFDFAPTEGAMTMTVDPAQHYVTEALLSAVLKWVEVCDDMATGNALALLPRLELLQQDMHRLGSELKALYEQEQM